MVLDLVIRGGTVVDGSGKARFTADVGIADGKIVEVGRVTSIAARTTVGAPMAAISAFSRRRSGSCIAPHHIR